MINNERLNGEIEECRREGIEYEVLIRDNGESVEESYQKFKNSRIISEQLMLIGRI